MGLYGSLTHRSVAATMAVAAGLLLAAATVELAAKAIGIGLTLKGVGPQMVLITAISLANLPEALSGSAGMLAAGRKPGWILSVWGAVAIATVALTGVGFVLADSISLGTSAVLELFGAGVLIAMVTETIIPEAVRGTPKFADTVAAVGFGALLLVGQLAH